MAIKTVPTQPKRRIYYGAAVHSLSPRKLEYLHDAVLGVDERGVISFVRPDVKAEEINSIAKSEGWEDVEIVKLARGEFLIPGLIDTHTHAPQFPNLGRGQQYQLLDWLSQLTFPTEAKFKNPVYAAKIYESVVNRVIASGTTTCCWYGTLHLEATKILASILHRRGQRSFVGKCNMDRHSAPDYTEKSAAQSLEDTKEFVSFVRSECNLSLNPDSEPASPLSPTPKSPIFSGGGTVVRRNGTTKRSSSHSRSNSTSSNSSTASSASSASSKRKTPSTALVQPILTPRFAISCSDALMAGLQAMVGKDPTLHIQTHLSENPAEIEFTKQLFPFTDSYTEVYDHFGLLTDKTILAHCVHLSEPEMSLIKERGAGISHCPNSNLNLRSGCSPVAELLDRGIKVGFGTDVSGGFGHGIFTALREASVVAKVLGFHQENATVNKDRGRSLTPKGQDSEAEIPTGLPPTENHDNDAAALETERFSGKHLPLETLFFLATLGGAQVCALEERIGNFKVGKEFDALLIRTGQKEPDFEGDAFEDQPNPALFVEETDTLEALFEKVLFAGDDRNIASVIVRGRIIGGAAPLQ